MFNIADNLTYIEVYDVYFRKYLFISKVVNFPITFIPCN